MLAFLYFFYDILHHLTQLSQHFQRTNLRFSDIDPMISATIKIIDSEYITLENNGSNFGTHLLT